MTIDEYLAFIPLLLYGLALADLFSQWRRFFESQYMYWPYVVTTFVLTEIAIWNIFISTDYLEVYLTVSYHQYWLFLLQPILFLILVHAFTPDKENRDTEGYFKMRMRLVFILFGIYIGSHLIPILSASSKLHMTRIGAIVICLAIAFSRKIWLVYLLGIFWLISFVVRGL